VAVLAGCDTPVFTIVDFVRKGLIWLLLATVAEVPPTVRVAILSRSSFPLIVIFTT
jgi:hypothetical protein